MAVAQARVTSAIAGKELLPWTTFPCVELAKHVLAALGSRPTGWSRLVEVMFGLRVRQGDGTFFKKGWPE